MKTTKKVHMHSVLIYSKGSRRDTRHVYRPGCVNGAGPGNNVQVLIVHGPATEGLRFTSRSEWPVCLEAVMNKGKLERAVII